MDETSAPDKAAAETLAATAPLADLVPKKVFTVIRATALQNKLLRDAFKETHITTPARLEQLEKETGLTKKWISSWFTRQRKKTQQATLKATATTSKADVENIDPILTSDASTLQVKKEVYECAIACPAVPPAPKKKRQRKTAPDGASGTNIAPKTKKRKVEPTNGPSSVNSSTTSSAKSSGSIFDKLKVKAERYTPGPEEPRPASTSSTLATTSDAKSHVPLRALLPLLQDPRLEASGVFEHGATYSAASGSDAAQTQRASSPSAVAMKGRRQRVQYAGEGPVLNTRFLHHGVSASNAPSPADTGPAYQEVKFGLDAGVTIPYHQRVETGGLGADRLGHSLHPVAGPGGGITGPYAAQTQPISTSASASLPNRIRIDTDATTSSMPITALPERQVCRGAMASAVSHREELEEEEEEGRRDPYPPPVLVDEVDTFDLQSAAAGCAIEGGGKVDSVGGGFWANGMPAPGDSRRAPGMRDIYTNAPPAAESYGQYPDFLDPLHAPLKHLTGILDPIFPPTSGRGGYEALLELEGRQRQVVMEKLLDEELGVNDPFKAAMGLVLTSKMGLQW
ncbi:hypothetical protein MD484_g3411, partial [Candolleomyces efflorescens]